MEDKITTITAKMIPQFSDFNDGVYRVVEILEKEGDRGLTFDEIGWFLQRQHKKKGAHKKYGENHTKLSELLGLIKIDNSTPMKSFLTDLGRTFYCADKKEKESMLREQLLNMAMVQDILKVFNDSFDLKKYLMKYLSEKTAKRRRPNVKRVFQELSKFEDIKIRKIYESL